MRLPTNTVKSHLLRAAAVLLVATSVIGSALAATQEHTTDMVFRAADLAQRFQASPARFVTEFQGKMLKVGGTVMRFYRRPAGPEGIDVILAGIIRSAAEADRDSDNVVCATTDAKAIKAAGDLELGKNVVVWGRYEPGSDAIGVDSTIVLHDCGLR